MEKKFVFLTILFCLFGTLFLIDQLEVFLPEYETITQVFLPDYFVGSQLFWLSLEQDLPLEQKIGTVGDGQGLLYVMVCDQNPNVSVLQSPYNMLNILHRDGIDSGKRLIQHDKLRLNGKATSDLCPTSFTSRELVVCILSHFIQSECIVQIFQFI